MSERISMAVAGGRVYSASERRIQALRYGWASFSAAELPGVRALVRRLFSAVRVERIAAFRGRMA